MFIFPENIETHVRETPGRATIIMDKEHRDMFNRLYAGAVASGAKLSNQKTIRGYNDFMLYLLEQCADTAETFDPTIDTYELSKQEMKKRKRLKE